MRCDRGKHGRKIVAMFFSGNSNDVGPEQSGDDWINGEAIFGDHHVGARRHQGVAEKFDDIVGTVSENEIRWRNLKVARELLFEIKRVAIGIKMGMAGGFLDGSQSGKEKGWAEGIFVLKPA